MNKFVQHFGESNQEESSMFRSTMSVVTLISGILVLWSTHYFELVLRGFSGTPREHILLISLLLLVLSLAKRRSVARSDQALLIGSGLFMAYLFLTIDDFLSYVSGTGRIPLLPFVLIGNLTTAAGYATLIINTLKRR